MQKWKKLRSYIAISLSAVMVLSVPVSAAGYETTYNPSGEIISVEEEFDATEDVSVGDILDISGGDISTGDGAAVEEPGSEIPGNEIELYQEKKLKVSVKNKAIILGQPEVILATVGYERTTSDDGLDFVYTVRKGKGTEYNSYEVQSQLKLEVKKLENNTKIQIYAQSGAEYGDYTLTLRAKGLVNEQNYAEKTEIPFQIVPAMDTITIDGSSYVYRKANTAVSLQLNAKGGRSDGMVPYKKDALKWYVSWDTDMGFIPCDPKDVTITAKGKLSISRTCKPLSDTLVVTVMADDYAQNATLERKNIHIVEKPVKVAGICVGVVYQGYKNVNTVAGDGEKVTPGQISDKNLSFKIYVSKDEEDLRGGYVYNPEEFYDSSLFTYKSSNPKAIEVDQKGNIYVHQITNKPVTLTATQLDGKTKLSMEISLETKKVSLSQLEPRVFTGYDIGSTAAGHLGYSCSCKLVYNAEKGCYEGHYDGKGDNYLRFELNYGTYEHKDDFGVKYTVKGAKVLNSNQLKMTKIYEKATGLRDIDDITRLNRVYFTPTAKTVEITATLGDESMTYYLIDDSYNAKKHTVQRGEPKLTTTATLYMVNYQQSLNLYVGKDVAKIYVRPNTMSYTSNFALYMNWKDDIIDTFRMNYTSTIPVNDGYATVKTTDKMLDYTGFANTYKSVYGVNAPSVVKYDIIPLDQDGNALAAPYTLTISIKKNPTKTDYKLPTSYTLKLGEAVTFASYGTFTTHHSASMASTNKATKDTMEIKKTQYYLQKDMLTIDSEAQNIFTQKINGQYYIMVSDQYAKKLFEEVNKSVIDAGKDPAVYGKDAKKDVNLYVEYEIHTADGHIIPKKQKIKVSLIVTKKNYKEVVELLKK